MFPNGRDPRFDQNDGPFDHFLKGLSERATRRSLLARAGQWLIGLTGVTVLSSLPVNRAFGQNAKIGKDGSITQAHDPTECNYWRYCNLSGTLCAGCVGGGLTSCPPGSQLGAEFWYGCCEDPESGQTYMIAYQDCCGKSNCGGSCGGYSEQTEPYNSAMPSQDNNILWCMSNESQTYTCTVAPIVAESCTTWHERSFAPQRARN